MGINKSLIYFKTPKIDQLLMNHLHGIVMSLLTSNIIMSHSIHVKKPPMNKVKCLKEIQDRLPDDLVIEDETSYEFTEDEFIGFYHGSNILIFITRRNRIVIFLIYRFP